MSKENEKDYLFGGEELYRAVVKFSPNAIVIHSEGKILYANPAAVKMYGAKSSEEMADLHILDIIHPDFQDEVMRRIKIMAEVGTVVPMIKLKCLKLGGEIRDAEILSVPIMYMGKSSVLVTIKDTTEQVEREAELQILSRVVKQSPNSIVITNREGLITYVNPRFEELTGYTKEEVLGQNPRVIQSGETPHAVYSEMWTTILEGGEWRGTIRNRKKDGSLYWEYVVISGLKNQKNSEITHFIAVKSDITKNKQNEEELRDHRDHLQTLVEERTTELMIAKEEAESANRAKSAFLANMSHEIRTPMNGIIGMTHIMRMRGIKDEQQGKYLAVIEKSGQHLLGVISNVLDLSKIEAGMLVLERSPIDINGLLTNSVSIQYEQAKAKGVRLLLEDTVSWPTNLVGDATRLQQALINYITNAIKFTNQGTVVIRTVKESESHNFLEIRFEVIDSGIGISQESKSKLFNVFEQLDSSMTRKYGGTGLGLSITKRLANLMGGNVGVESEPGKGSTFWFTARLEKAERREDPLRVMENFSVEDAVRKDHSGKSILVVDDEPINREIARLQLEFVGLVVDLAEDGEEAIRMAKKTPYAAIFMDMQMPKINGLEATKQIRMLPEYKEIPIIAVTANVSHDDKKFCAEAGMNDFVIKPFDPNDLFGRLLKWMPK